MSINNRLSYGVILLSLITFAFPNQSAESDNRKHRLEFLIPEDPNLPPEIAIGKETIFVFPGEQLETSLAGSKGTVMLVIESAETPFASGKYRVTINSGRGNAKKLRFADRPGSYKYSIVDISNNPHSEDRPIKDPVIIIKD